MVVAQRIAIENSCCRWSTSEYMESCEKQVNTWRVVGGKRANSLKWDHTGGGEEEHSVIEAYKLQTAKLA